MSSSYMQLSGVTDPNDVNMTSQFMNGTINSAAQDKKRVEEHWCNTLHNQAIEWTLRRNADSFNIEDYAKEPELAIDGSSAAA